MIYSKYNVLLHLQNNIIALCELRESVKFRTDILSALATKMNRLQWA